MSSYPLDIMADIAMRDFCLGDYDKAALELSNSLRHLYPGYSRGDLSEMPQKALDLRMTVQYLTAARVSRWLNPPDVEGYIAKAADVLLTDQGVKAVRMAKLQCRLCQRLRPCGQPNCIAYAWSDQEGRDQKGLRKMIADADARSSK